MTVGQNSLTLMRNYIYWNQIKRPHKHRSQSEVGETNLRRSIYYEGHGDEICREEGVGGKSDPPQDHDHQAERVHSRKTRRDLRRVPQRAEALGVYGRACNV